MFFQQVPHAVRILQRSITLGEAVLVELIVPGGFIVFAIFRVVAAEQAVVKGEVFPHQQAGVGVGVHVFAVNLVIGDQVQQDARQESNVGT